MGTRWSCVKPGAGIRRGSSRKPLDSRAFDNCMQHQLNQTVKQKILKKSVTLSPPPGNPGDMRHVLWPRSRLAQRRATWAAWDQSAAVRAAACAGCPEAPAPFMWFYSERKSSPRQLTFPSSLVPPGCPHKLLKALHVRLRFPGP